MNRFPSEGPSRRRLLATVPALLVTAPTVELPTASRVMLPLAVPDVPVKVVPAVKAAVPALTV